jgi:hypothetical protein
MVHINKSGILLVLITLSGWVAAQHDAPPPKDIILMKGLRTAYLPFSSFTKPVFEITNNQLNIAVTDAKGNMLQLNGIAIEQLKNGILDPSSFQTVLMMAHDGTFTDDMDTNSRSLLEIKCANNKENSPITVGLKTSIRMNGKNIRVYATLSGLIPSYQYQRTN